MQAKEPEILNEFPIGNLEPVRKRALVPEDLLRYVFVTDPQMHPQGDCVLFLKKTIDEKNKYRTALATVDLSGQIREWTRSDAGASHGRWSPDGEAIAFLSSREGSCSQIFLLARQGGEARALTALPEGDFGGFRWSPDGRHILFTFRERDSLWTEKAQKERGEKGLSTPARIADTPMYRWDGEGFCLNQRYALFSLELETGNVEELDARCPWGRYSFGASPDGSRIAFTRSFQRNTWRDPEDDRILIRSKAGRAKELAGQPKGEKRTLRWSPDGKWIAYLGSTDPLDHRGVGNTELFVAPAAGGTPVRLTKGYDYDLETSTLSDMGEVGGEFLEWLPDSSGLLVAVGWHGACHVAKVTLEGVLSFLTSGPCVFGPGGTSADGRVLACLVSDPLRPAEVAVVGISSKKPDVRRLTAFNQPLVDEVQPIAPDELWLNASDGYPVHCWVIRPRGAASKKTPAVLEIHGGPQAQYGWTFFNEFQLLAAAGYTVVYANPRGSKGYGRAHVEAISGHWGHKDWLDVEAVKEWMKSDRSIDSRRMGVMGGSYGGYMVNWVVGHTGDFRAAITDRCVSNLLSKALNSDYPYYPGTYWRGSGYGPLESNEDLWRDSPLAYFDRVRTPMLVIHSEGDLRCNIEQGEQVFTALQERRIPSRMVRYPISTSHGMSRGGPPDLRIHRLKEILSWWKRWL